VAPRPFVPLTDGAQAEIRYNYGLGILETRLWFVSRQPPVDLTQLQALADGLLAHCTLELIPLLSSDIELRNVRTRRWVTAGDIAAISTTVNIAGGISSKALSANCAARINIRGPQPPRNFRNFNFVPGIPDNKVTLNTLDSTWRNNLRIAYADIIDKAPLWGPFPAWRWVVTSQEEAGAPRSEQLAARADIVSVETTVRQRRIRLLHT